MGRAPSRLPRTGTNNAGLMLNNVFLCDGYLMKVRYYRGSPDGSAYLGIWKVMEEGRYALREKIELPPAPIGVQTVDVPRVFVNRGDFIGIHYPRGLPQGVVVSALREDNLVRENELYYTYSLPIYDEDITPNVPIDAKQLGGEVVRSTYGLEVTILPGKETSQPVPTLIPPELEDDLIEREGIMNRCKNRLS